MTSTTETARLTAAARRALAALNDLISDSRDPGTEALGAQFELEQALIPAVASSGRAALLHKTADKAAALLREAADIADEVVPPDLPRSDRDQGRVDAAADIRKWADFVEVEAELRRVAAEEQPADTQTHSCRNCEGIDPDTCLMNPNRPPEQCPNSEFDGYGLQCQKPAGHNLCTFEEEAAATERPVVVEQPDTQETHRGC